MRKSGRVLIVWTLVFLVGILSTAASIVPSGYEISREPAIVNEDVVTWTFKMHSNETKQRSWLVGFDNYYPGDTSTYSVYPKFFVSSRYTNNDASGSFNVTITYYFNSAQIHREVFSTHWSSEDSKLSWAGWTPSERDLEKFLSATPGDSGNLFDVVFLVETMVTQPGDGEIEIQAGPLLLYAKEPAETMGPFGIDPIIMLIVMGVIALPLAVAIEYLMPRLSDGVKSPAKVKRKRRDR